MIENPNREKIMKNIVEFEMMFYMNYILFMYFKTD